MIVDIVIAKFFVVDHIDRITIKHIVVNYKQIKNIIVVDTQIVNNVINIKIVDIIVVDILKSNRNEN